MSAHRRVTAAAAPLREKVVIALRDDIVTGRLEPGSWLRESMLCNRYGVSRTVVREALRQLETERLVTMLPNRGPIVTVLDEPEIISLYEVRAELEGMVGELFVKRATDDTRRELADHFVTMHQSYLNGSVSSREASKQRFYGLMLRGAANPVLSETVHSIHRRVAVFRYVAFTDDTRVAASMDELQRIVDACTERQDARAARRACVDHIRRAGRLAVVEYRAWLDRLRAS
ncbi:MAG: GntR family transcriptional regulator [Microcella sp.]